MTDKKTIWHLPTEPVQERFIIAIIDEKLYPFFGVYYLDEGSYLTKAQDWSDVERWCFLDDLLELSNKVESLESEVSRYKNALEKIKEVLIENTPNGDTLLEETIYFITQALKEIDSIKAKGE